LLWTRLDITGEIKKRSRNPEKIQKKEETWIKCTPNVSGETLVGEKFNMRRRG
jgi:hypothetical protein